MKVSLFHAGPPKTATTWVYACLKEHPRIITSPSDTIHYFDMFYPKGEKWYLDQFDKLTKTPETPVYFDPTYSYICAPRAPERIAKYNPDAKVMVCLRNPVERAFSHYWHVKKQTLSADTQFEDVLKHYNHFATIVEHGFVGLGLKQFYDVLPKENIYVMLFDDLKKNPEEEFQKIAKFCDLNDGFKPSMLTKKINVAGPKKTFIQQNLNRLTRRVVGTDNFESWSKNFPLFRALSGKSEYLEGMSADMRARLQEICIPEIEELESLTGYDLGHWIQKTQKKDAA